MTNKYKYFVVFTIVVLVISVGLIYYVKETEDETSISVPQISTTTPQTVSVLGNCQYKDLEDWKRYYNSDLSISICYPTNFKLAEGETGVGFIPSELLLKNEKGWPNDVISVAWISSGANPKQSFKDFVEYLARGHDGFQKFDSFKEIVTYKGLRGYTVTYWAENWITGTTYITNPMVLFEHPDYNPEDLTSIRGIIIQLFSSDFIDTYNQMIKTFEFK